MSEMPPKSAVSIGSGLTGFAVMIGTVTWAILQGWEIVPTIFLVMGATALASAMWDVFVDKVHLRASTGMDYSAPRPFADIKPIVITKLIGLAVTFGLVIGAYTVLRSYRSDTFTSYFAILALVGPILMLASPFYVLLTTRYMVEPKDKLWEFGRFVTGPREDVDLEAVKDHLLGWTIKAFFLAFLAAVIPYAFKLVMLFDFASIASDPVMVFVFLMGMFFLADAVFGTFGYALTLRPLDSHIRSANPYLAGWVAALVCYPPFALMLDGGPLDYRIESADWQHWFEGMPVLLGIWGAILTMLVLVYGWATVIFGIRFSNLTNRGIITTGPYRYFKHPAYLSKVIYWWLVSMPFFTVSPDPLDAVRNCALLGIVSGIYYIRAKTEEKHLMADPDYRAYSDWIAVHGVLPRLRRRLARAVRPGAVESEGTG
ncbi:methyltransferase family protein [Jannaschia aquimarina]|uniref:Isoprenylcysteine carboxyl methyltransferase (ICMT) family protein n=1 Tax=Jannaschia aquimarina TaxID=935700 RepID=A0A0D1EGX3_9RHOB|nr:isoprenylcysteine carboxylmethyltransferase family protein [Jannaschia aquimarina]KIT16151.1 hypothetical protein jaqu_21130 [Jannaschia aquimarina]SNT37097.1 Protein-S-isoprenylcysteine O-methyltransferase Ste14 [Jannaschia aquimarina]